MMVSGAMPCSKSHQDLVPFIVGETPTRDRAFSQHFVHRVLWGAFMSLMIPSHTRHIESQDEPDFWARRRSIVHPTSSRLGPFSAWLVQIREGAWGAGILLWSPDMRFRLVTRKYRYSGGTFQESLLVRNRRWLCRSGLFRHAVLGCGKRIFKGPPGED
jgi:hypothetical protein